MLYILSLSSNQFEISQKVTMLFENVRGLFQIQASNGSRIILLIFAVLQNNFAPSAATARSV